MRYDAEHKHRTRDRILREAAKALRDSGPNGISVASVMREAGLTHGGFYAHFSSKEALVADTIAYAMAQSHAVRAEEMAGKSPREALCASIDQYLSMEHRERRAEGCPVAGLASDLPRLASAEAQQAFAAGVEDWVVQVEDVLMGIGYAAPKGEARSVVSELVGALILARCEPDSDRARALIEGARHQLKARLGLNNYS